MVWERVEYAGPYRPVGVVRRLRRRRGDSGARRGFAAYTAYASPGTTVEERQVSSWEGNGTYTTAARVTEPNPLYPVDTDLSNRPAYFLSVSPEMQGRFGFSYRASDGGSLDVGIRNRLVMRAASEGRIRPSTGGWRSRLDRPRPRTSVPESR
ncbi:hypothetical protein ACFQL0_12795 [Haloplanus litoreus]|uniref:hypothetical protein n=1 Tax=Haloplanus litoreus TaxID=767515 RepID=UPI003612EE1C